MRTLNRLLALVVAIALVAFAVLFTIEVVAAFLGNSPVLIHWHSAYADGERDTWNTAHVRAIAIVVAAVGLLLLLVQLRPRRPDTLSAGDRTDGVTTGLTRPGIRHALAGAAAGVDGVSKARVTLRRRAATVTATTYSEDPGTLGPLRERVRRQVDSKIESMDLTRPPKVKLVVRTSGGDQ